MTKVRLVLETKLGEIALYLCRFSIKKLALCLNEGGHGFADHFNDTECIEVGMVSGPNSR